MPGLGKYKKGAKFTLKSGNNPAFKMIAGESPITSPANMNSFGVGKGTSPYKQAFGRQKGAFDTKQKYTFGGDATDLGAKEAGEKITVKNAQKSNAAKAAKKAKLGAAGRNLAEIFMGGIHNVYGNPDKSSKTTEFDEEKAYKRWAKEKSDKETMTLAQQIIADDKKKSQIKKA